MRVTVGASTVFFEECDAGGCQGRAGMGRYTFVGERVWGLLIICTTRPLQDLRLSMIFHIVLDRLTMHI